MDTVGTLHEAQLEATNTLFANTTGDGLSLYNRTMRTLAGMPSASQLKSPSRPSACCVRPCCLLVAARPTTRVVPRRSARSEPFARLTNPIRSMRDVELWCPWGV